MSKTGDLQRSCRDPREDVWENRRGTESGKFLVVIRGGLASGIAAQDGEPGGITLAGSANGNSVSLSWSWTEGVGGAGPCHRYHQRSVDRRNVEQHRRSERELERERVLEREAWIGGEGGRRGSRLSASRRR